MKRTNLKIFPTADIVSDDPKDICYDQFQNSGILINEPVLAIHQSSDLKWFYVYTYNCSGWVWFEDIALCLDKETWTSRRASGKQWIEDLTVGKQYEK